MRLKKPEREDVVVTPGEAGMTAIFLFALGMTILVYGGAYALLVPAVAGVTAITVLVLAVIRWVMGGSRSEAEDVSVVTENVLTLGRIVLVAAIVHANTGSVPWMLTTALVLLGWWLWPRDPDDSTDPFPFTHRQMAFLAAGVLVCVGLTLMIRTADSGPYQLLIYGAGMVAAYALASGHGGWRYDLGEAAEGIADVVPILATAWQLSLTTGMPWTGVVAGAGMLAFVFWPRDEWPDE
jgi:hypothetical protein